MKVYYAHSLHLYNTNQELRDIETLEKLGLEVSNPNNESVQSGIEEYKIKFGDNKSMEYFESLIEDCEVFAFRAHPDGKIPSGVGFELNYAKGAQKVIIELPSLVSTRNLSLEDTREYLKLLGQR